MVRARALVPHESQNGQERATVGKAPSPALREGRAHLFRERLHPARNVGRHGHAGQHRDKPLVRLVGLFKFLQLFRTVASNIQPRAARLETFLPGLDDRQQRHECILFLNAQLGAGIEDVPPRAGRNLFLKEEIAGSRDARLVLGRGVEVAHQRVPAALFHVVHGKERRNTSYIGRIAAPEGGPFLGRGQGGGGFGDGAGDLVGRFLGLFAGQLLKADRTPTLRRGRRKRVPARRGAAVGAPFLNHGQQQWGDVPAVERVELGGQRGIVTAQALDLVLGKGRAPGARRFLKETEQGLAHGFHGFAHGNRLDPARHTPPGLADPARGPDASAGEKVSIFRQNGIFLRRPPAFRTAEIPDAPIAPSIFTRIYRG